MESDPRACMFCHDELAAADEPENLAFIDHLDEAPACQDAFDAWTENMATDFLGD
ncbi:MAG: hypothetical protein QOD77_2121 [Thermoplasmata archaeon]|jgi:hypothetical protein|nr:hypothetical protein [Thermoplasmata archaeon]